MPEQKQPTWQENVKKAVRNHAAEWLCGLINQVHDRQISESANYIAETNWNEYDILCAIADEIVQQDAITFFQDIVFQTRGVPTSATCRSQAAVQFLRLQKRGDVMNLRRP